MPSTLKTCHKGLLGRYVCRLVSGVSRITFICLEQRWQGTV